jgi:PPIC-type PPIASE domain
VRSVSVPRLSAIAVLLAVASATADCGSSASPKVAATHDTAHTDVAPAKATPVTTSTASVDAAEAIVKIGRSTITRGLLVKWTAAALSKQAGAPMPPAYEGCIKLFSETIGTTATTEQLKRTCERKYVGYLHKSLSSLIYSYWLIGEAANAASEAARRTPGDIGDAISGYRLNAPGHQSALRIRRKLEAQVPRATDAKVADYFSRHKASFALPERRDLYLVRLGSLTEASTAKREIEAGASFAKIVGKTTLMQPEEAHGGLIHGVEARNWPEPPLSKEVFRAPLGALEGPVHISLGYYVFKVVRKTPSREVSLTEAKPEVIRQMILELQKGVFSRYAATFRRKWAAKTVCLPGDLDHYCNGVRSSSGSARELLSLH